MSAIRGRLVSALDSCCCRVQRVSDLLEALCCLLDVVLCVEVLSLGAYRLKASLPGTLRWFDSRRLHSARLARTLDMMDEGSSGTEAHFCASLLAVGRAWAWASSVVAMRSGWSMGGGDQVLAGSRRWTAEWRGQLVDERTADGGWTLGAGHQNAVRRDRRVLPVPMLTENSRGAN